MLASLQEAEGQRDDDGFRSAGRGNFWERWLRGPPANAGNAAVARQNEHPHLPDDNRFAQLPVINTIPLRCVHLAAAASV